MEIALSTSAFNDAARCLKRYEYRWVERLVPKPRDVRPVLRRGVWIHRCLQLHDEGLDWQTELQSMAAWAIDQGISQDDVFEMMREVIELVEDYLAYWQGHEESPGPWTTENTEVPVEWEVRPGILLTATIDRLARDREGNLWIWERKSTQDIPDSDWRTVDPQTMLQFMIARAMELPIRGIVFDYICTRPGRVPRITNQGRFYQSDENMATRGRYFAKAEAQMRKNRQPEQYINEMRSRVVADGQWFQRFVTMRPDENGMLTLKDVAVTIRHINAAAERNYYPRAINLLDCRLFCPYGKLCMAEYQLGHPSVARREEYLTLSTDDNWQMGRTG